MAVSFPTFGGYKFCRKKLTILILRCYFFFVWGLGILTFGD